MGGGGGYICHKSEIFFKRLCEYIHLIYNNFLLSFYKESLKSIKRDPGK